MVFHVNLSWSYSSQSASNTCNILDVLGHLSFLHSQWRPWCLQAYYTDKSDVFIIISAFWGPSSKHDLQTWVNWLYFAPLFLKCLNRLCRMVTFAGDTFVYQVIMYGQYTHNSSITTLRFVPILQNILLVSLKWQVVWGNVRGKGGMLEKAVKLSFTKLKFGLSKAEDSKSYRRIFTQTKTECLIIISNFPTCQAQR